MILHLEYLNLKLYLFTIRYSLDFSECLFSEVSPKANTSGQKKGFFLMGESLFLIGASLFFNRRKSFFNRRKSFFNRRKSFLIGESLFLIGEILF